MKAFQVYLGLLPLLIVMASAHSMTEQEVVDMLARNSSRPEHVLVYAHNLNADPGNPPPGISTQSQGTIKNAWAAIATVMPLVEDLGANVTWITPNGTMRTVYDYDYQIPSSTPGCGSTYSFDSTGVEFEAYAETKSDKQLLGMRNGVAGYSLPAQGSRASFNVTTTFWVKYIEHLYHQEYECEDDVCWPAECVYDGSITHEDRLPVNDSRTYQLYSPEHYEKILVDRRTGDVVQGRFYFDSSQPVDGLLLSAGESFFSLDFYDYRAVQAEYNMKRIQAVPRDARLSTTGLFSDINASLQEAFFYFSSQGVHQARLIILTHFGELEVPLELNSIIPTALELQAGRSYSSHQALNPSALLKDASDAPLPGREVIFKYAGLNVRSLTNASGVATAAFTPVAGQNVMSARFPGDDDYGESHDIAHFFIGRYTLKALLYVAIVAGLSYYLTIRTIKWGIRLIARGGEA